MILSPFEMVATCNQWVGEMARWQQQAPLLWADAARRLLYVWGLPGKLLG